MFTPDERAGLRAALLQHAALDPRLSGVAVTGSGASHGGEDRWSDVDLAFGVREAAELPEVLAAWTGHLYRHHGALHHLDVMAGAWIYRVFLLPGTLQVDLAFAPAMEFRALAPTFRLVCGEANEPRYVDPPVAEVLIGMSWLYALHARNCIARSQVWQAEYMISAVRDHVLALACLRHGLPAVHGKGMDLLPGDVTAVLEGALVTRLNTEELLRAFRVVVQALVVEIRAVDGELAVRLGASLAEIYDGNELIAKPRPERN